MAKFLFIGSTEKMTAYAQSRIDITGRKDIEAVFIPATQAPRAVMRAREADVQIIIARGFIAAEIKKHTDRPVVEIAITVQELGLLIKQAKALLHKERPVIAIVGISKMFCDMRDFDELFDIKLMTCFVETWDALEGAVRDTRARGADLIIGGEIVGGHARAQNIPFLFQPDGRDSIDEAFRIADSVAWAADMEKKNAAEFKALLDFSSNGIIKVDRKGRIVSLNDQILSILDKTREEAEGRRITELIPAIDGQQTYWEALKRGREMFFTFWHESGVAVAVNVVPLTVDRVVTGAIFSFHVINKLRQIEADARRDLYQNERRGNELDWLPGLFAENAAFLQSARNLAQYDECVLLVGSHSTEREMIARYMHGVSLRGAAPFVCACVSTFGAKEAENEQAVLNGKGGTIFLDRVERLMPDQQDILFRLLTDGLADRHRRGTLNNVQILLGTRVNLAEAVREGTFREDLYYIVSALALDMPLLESCPNEIKNWLEHYMDQYAETYSNALHITRAARNAILAHPWHGGLAELRSFCCKAAINASRGILDEPTVLRYLRGNNPYAQTDDASQHPAIGAKASSEAARLRFLIEKYDGNRVKIAEEMHISVTTLWRRLKKYDLL